MNNNSKNTETLMDKFIKHLREYKIRYFICTGVLIAGLISLGFVVNKENSSKIAITTNVNSNTNGEASKSSGSPEKNSEETKSVSTNIDTSKNGVTTTEESKKSTYVPKFKKVESSKDPNKDMATRIEVSPNGKLKAQLDGRGISADEEGVADIFIIDDKSKKWRLQIVDNDIKFTPMNLEWLDDKNLLVTMGYSQGHSSYGGSVYVVNIDSATAALKYEVDINKEQVKSITRLDNGIKLKVIVFTDDIQNNYREEERIIKK